MSIEKMDKGSAFLSTHVLKPHGKQCSKFGIGLRVTGIERDGIAKVPLGEKHLAKHLGELQFGTDDELDNIFPEVRGLLRSEGMMKDLLGPPSLLGKKQSFKHSLLS